MDTNTKSADAGAAKRTLSSRLPFRPDSALKFLKRGKKEDRISEIPEGTFLFWCVPVLEKSRMQEG